MHTYDIVTFSSLFCIKMFYLMTTWLEVVTGLWSSIIVSKLCVVVNTSVFIPSALYFRLTKEKILYQNLSQGRATVGTFLAQEVSRDVTGTYVPPFYQLSGEAVAEVWVCMT